MSDRYCNIAISKDGGNNWGEPTQHSLGEIGDFLSPVIRRRLGTARHMVVRLSVSSPMPATLLALQVQDAAEG